MHVLQLGKTEIIFVVTQLPLATRAGAPGAREGELRNANQSEPGLQILCCSCINTRDANTKDFVGMKTLCGHGHQHVLEQTSPALILIAEKLWKISQNPDVASYKLVLLFVCELGVVLFACLGVCLFSPSLALDHVSLIWKLWIESLHTLVSPPLHIAFCLTRLTVSCRRSPRWENKANAISVSMIFFKQNLFTM